jgi:hypothetical protein
VHRGKLGVVLYVLAVVVGLVFGGADQYAGSLAAIPWLTSSSLLSAPWLVLPFVFGCTQSVPRRAMLVGCVATASALLGYFTMTLSPIEGVHLGGSVSPVVGLLRSEAKVIAGGMLTAPLYGFLGQRWRTRRSWVSALFVAGAVCLEPLAEGAVGRLPRESAVWVIEVGCGVALATYFIFASGAHRRELAGDTSEVA